MSAKPNKTSMLSRTHIEMVIGSVSRQGLIKYWRKRCCRGLSSCGCKRRTGSIVTQPKMRLQTVQRERICGSSSSKPMQAQRGPSVDAPTGFTLQPGASTRPRKVGTGPLPSGSEGAAPPASAAPLTPAPPAWLPSNSDFMGCRTSRTSGRTQSVTLGLTSCSCIMPTSPETSLTARTAAPGSTRLFGNRGLEGTWSDGAPWLSPRASSRTSSGDGSAALAFHLSKSEPLRTASTIRHSRPSVLGR
mmetsp:Transcript_87883/g.262056  ORF Transcript_87883/g.262056 Transcript_87883/m.262056 type:complete len:246 (-) Transcript_87883:639-1376(-)